MSIEPLSARDAKLSAAAPLGTVLTGAAVADSCASAMGLAYGGTRTAADVDNLVVGAEMGEVGDGPSRWPSACCHRHGRYEFGEGAERPVIGMEGRGPCHMKSPGRLASASPCGRTPGWRQQ